LDDQLQRQPGKHPGQHVIQHDPQTTMDMPINPADRPRFDDIKQSKQSKA
jgi:hypothetical protein